MEIIELNENIYNVRCFDYIKKIKKTIKSGVWESWKSEVGDEKAFAQLGSKDGKDIPDKYALYYFDIGMLGENICMMFDTKEEAQQKYCEILAKVKDYNDVRE